MGGVGSAGGLLVGRVRLSGSVASHSSVLRGRAGDDLLYGQAGNDTLDGGPDTDTCRGGTGIDTASACETTVGVP